MKIPGMLIFTLEAGDGYLPQPSDNWIIISSSSGNLLDYQLLQAGTFMLEESPSFQQNTYQFHLCFSLLLSHDDYSGSGL